MKRYLITAVLTLLLKCALAQNVKDSLVYQLPMVNDQLIYKDTVKVTGNKTLLDSAAGAWFKSYFQNYRPYPADREVDTSAAVFDQAMLTYKVSPGLIAIDYFAAVSIKITTGNNFYTYKIYEISFRPKNGVLNKIGYQNDPEYLIKLYKRKHLGLITSMSLSRGMIREYLDKMNTAVIACIASLNRAMANKTM
ncbi:hypothetical protein [Mucilaginibacter psychrotolerans]|uniref:DUF4468 domain-containing protein n=1 Tax=Mucilaginibacter psychrotolerans TaxID=1524096 RepID=A0A4Y8S2M8_9SPHI|nr:hypothetical protein [Mucilaginibacter psychrotolerans]TFF33299.1 hypothetical protein E2R66_26530 [Mucilaginibacter psychrotolerans]